MAEGNLIYDHRLIYAIWSREKSNLISKLNIVLKYVNKS